MHLYMSLFPSVRPSRTIPQKSYNMDHNFWCACVKWGVCFIFPKFCFLSLEVDKTAKTVQNDKKFCLSSPISQEPCMIYDLWYTSVNQWYPQVLFFIFFKILILRIVSGVKGQKNGPKWQKIVCLTLSVRNRTSYDFDFWDSIKVESYREWKADVFGELR